MYVRRDWSCFSLLAARTATIGNQYHISLIEFSHERTHEESTIIIIILSILVSQVSQLMSSMALLTLLFTMTHTSNFPHQLQQMSSICNGHRLHRRSIALVIALSKLFRQPPPGIPLLTASKEEYWASPCYSFIGWSTGHRPATHNATGHRPAAHNAIICPPRTAALQVKS